MKRSLTLVMSLVLAATFASVLPAQGKRGAQGQNRAERVLIKAVGSRRGCMVVAAAAVRVGQLAQTMLANFDQNGDAV